jgi:hypothetical protein
MGSSLGRRSHGIDQLLLDDEEGDIPTLAYDTESMLRFVDQSDSMLAVQSGFQLLLTGMCSRRNQGLRIIPYALVRVR